MVYTQITSTKKTTVSEQGTLLHQAEESRAAEPEVGHRAQSYCLTHIHHLYPKAQTVPNPHPQFPRLLLNEIWKALVYALISNMKI